MLVQESFDLKYKKYTELISNDFAILDNILLDLIQKNYTPLNENFSKYLFSTSKRIRSTLIFLMAKAINNFITEKQYQTAASIELIHNATLIHDDIIDESTTRRKQKTLHTIFSTKLAVIAGDFLFALGFQNLTQNSNSNNFGIYSEMLKTLCQGEIEQYFQKGEIITIEEYIKKSAYKTSALFKAGLSGAFFDYPQEHKKAIENFADNFGIAFQIRNDLLNFFNPETNNNLLEDIKNGTYTAPVIYALKEHPNLLSEDDIMNSILRTGAFEKTKELLQTYIKLSVDNLSFISDNIYKEALVGICKTLGDFR